MKSSNFKLFLELSFKKTPTKTKKTENDADLADVSEQNIKINDSELNNLENEIGSFDLTTGS